MTHRLFLLLFGLLLALSATAQFTPQGFNYQCIVRDDKGNPVKNQTVTLVFSIRSGAANGPLAYSEKQVSSTNEYGLVNLIIGQGGTPLTGTFTGINWGANAKFLTVSVQSKTDPTVFQELGTSQMMSVPYALYAANGGGSAGDNWGTQTASTGPTLSGNGTASSPLAIAQQGAQNGQVLKWDGVTWAPAPDTDTNSGGTVTQINTGLGLTGGPISGNGTIALAPTGVVPNTYGSATQVPVIQVDETGRITQIGTVSVNPGNSVAINGGAGIGVQQTGSTFTITNTGDTNPNDDVTTVTGADGDIVGIYSNLQIKPGAVTDVEILNQSINGAKLSQMGAQTGQILKWNGAVWAPANESGGSSLNLNAGTAISITGTAPNLTINNTGDTNPNDDLSNTTAFDGDVSGVFNNLQVKAGVINTLELANMAVTATKLDDMGAQTGQVLKWNGTAWAPATDNTGGGGGSLNLSAGPGINITGTSPNLTIVNTGDTNANDDITANSGADGDVAGIFTNLQIKAFAVGTLEIANQSVNGDKIAPMNAQNGQVLKFNGATWAPAPDNGGSINIAGGAGIDVTLNNGTYTIVNTGDTNPNNDLTNATIFDGDVSGPSNNLQLKAAVVTSNELANNSVTTNAVINGAITGAKINNMGAGVGQVLKFNGTTWAPADDNVGGGGGANVNTNQTLIGNGTLGNPLGIAPQNAAAGQVLKFNGVTWLPANDETGGTVTTDATLKGNGTAANPLGLAPQGATNGQVLKFNGTAWVPQNEKPGDNWGAQVVVTNTNLTGNGTAANPLKFAQQGATLGQVLRWDGSDWKPASVTGDNWGSQTVITTPVLSGAGINASPLTLAQQNAAPGQVLKWDGSSWSPEDDQVGGGTGNNYTAGPGISITGISPNFVISNTGDADNNATNELQQIAIAGNTITLNKGGGSITLPAQNNYTAGTGISITGSAPNFTIVNTGDNDKDPTNELQKLELNGSILSLTSGNQVDLSGLGGGGNGLWVANGPHIKNGNLGNVLINTANGSGHLQVSATTGQEAGYFIQKSADPVAAIVAESEGSGPAAVLTSASGPALVTKEGNVGIHTDAPAFRLDVDGDGRYKAAGVKPQLTLENTALQHARMMFTSTNLTGNGWHVLGRGSGNTSDFGIEYIKGAGQGFRVFTARIDSGLVLGFPAIASTVKVLHGEKGLVLENIANKRNWEFRVSPINGTLALYNDQLGGIPAGTFAINGVYTPSDSRLKKDIEDMDADVTDKLLQLHPVSYRYKVEDEDAKPTLGFLAEEVQGIFPELVGESENRGSGSYLSLNYAGFGVLAVKAVQEQQAEIEKLKTEKQTLMQQVESLETRLKRLEALTAPKK